MAISNAFYLSHEKINFFWKMRSMDVFWGLIITKISSFKLIFFHETAWLSNIHAISHELKKNHTEWCKNEEKIN